MGKQVVAAIVSVLLPFLAWLLVFVPILVTAAVYGQGDPELTAGAMAMPLVFVALASVSSFCALIYLRLHYGTMAFLGLASSGAAISVFTLAPIGPAVAGAVTSVLLGGGAIATLWFLLKWVYAESDPKKIAEEF